MTLEECYEKTGGDWKGVLARMQNEERVRKFALKFLDDPNFKNLCDAIEKKDFKSAFIAAHTIKGTCQNLGFDTLFKSSSDLTENLRNSDTEPDINIFERVKNDYAELEDALKKVE